MNAGRLIVLVVGAAILVTNGAGVIVVLIVPRSTFRLVTSPMRAVRATFRRLAVLARSYPIQDRILAMSEPVALVVLLASWLTVAIIGFTLVNWGAGSPTMDEAFSEAGSSVFTLGFTLSHHAGSQIVDFVAAGTGLVLVALQIAYLPTLYSAYNRRETLVTLLESRAGAPAWGPELLIRHQLVGLIDNLPSLFAEWERWAADVAESHTSYPSLLYLRSPRAQNSWVISLLAVLDAAAIVEAIDPDGAPIEARMMLRMGFTCMREIAQVTKIPFHPDPSPDDPIALPEHEFTAAYSRLQEVGYTTSRTDEEAWSHFRGWRVNYEGVAYALASALNAPPARWSGPRTLFEAESLEPSRPVDRQPTVRKPGPA
jgi:hypothetical protein